jgi:BirA family biotin operon repressor/biotin-[acetyl-CoA-carboxylase] ligase
MVADVTGAPANSTIRPGPEGTRFTEVRWVDETGSTNADLLEAATQGAPDGAVLVADHQREGRGRLDRIWEAPAGSSLLVSVLLRPVLDPADAFLLTSAAGVAAVDASRLVAGCTPGLKWPNDLVAVAGDRHRGRKLGGILAETLVVDHRLEAVVIGMGLNVNWPDPLPPALAGTVDAINHVVGHEIDRAELLDAWLRRLDHWLDVLGDGSGRVALLERVRVVSATLGRDVRVELPGGRSVEGEAVDVTDGGHLLVQPGGGRPPVEVTVGDVVHARLR